MQIFQPVTFASLDKKIGFFNLPGPAAIGIEQGVAADELTVPAVGGARGAGGGLISPATTSSESSESSSEDDDTDTKSSERSFSARQKQKSSAGGRDAIKRWVNHFNQHLLKLSQNQSRAEIVNSINPRLREHAPAAQAC